MSRRLFVVAVAIAAIVASFVLHAQEESPYVENPVLPKYRTFSYDELRSALAVRASRSYAAFGYNVPKIVVTLPAADNSVFAEVFFDDPALFDASEAPVVYTREDGNYDHETSSSDVRMTDEEGEPVAYARAKGRATVRYPAKVRTHRVSASDGKKMAELGLRLDGRTVTTKVDTSVAEPATFAPIDPVRAFDATGRMIARDGGWSGGIEDGVEYRSYTYLADVSAIEVDRVEEWIGLEIDYDAPAAPARDELLAGTLPEPDPLIAATPPAKVSISPATVVPRSVLGSAAGLATSDIIEMLQSHGYPSIDGSAMLRAISESDIEVVRLLLAAGVSPNEPSGDTVPILVAASFAEAPLIRLLIDAGAAVNATDQNGSTALIQMANRCSTSEVSAVARELIDAGANVNAKAKGGGTALMMADVLQCTDLASILRAAGASEWK